MSEHETPGQRARRLLKGTTPGPWRCDRYDVVPMRARSEGWLIADCGTSDSPDEADANAALIAAAPDLAHALIAAEERVAALEAAIERVRPVVEALAVACDSEGSDEDDLPIDVHCLLLDLGRIGTSFDADAAWLRSLLPAARS